MSPRHWYVVGFALIAVICITAFIVAAGEEFGGADGQGEEEIGNINPDFEPWFTSLWEPPAETESMIFALQAAIGAIIIGFFIGNERGKRVAAKKLSETRDVPEKLARAEAVKK